MAFKIRNPFAAKTFDKSSPELMETKRSDPDNSVTDDDGVSDGDESRLVLGTTVQTKGATLREGGDGAAEGQVVLGGVKTSEESFRVAAGDVNSDGSPGTVAENATSRLKDTLRTQVRTVGDGGGEQGDGLAVDGARKSGSVIMGVQQQAGAASAGDDDGDGPADVVQYRESDLEFRQPGGDMDPARVNKIDAMSIKQREAGVDMESDTASGDGLRTVTKTSSNIQNNRMEGAGEALADDGGADDSAMATIGNIRREGAPGGSSADGSRFKSVDGLESETESLDGDGPDGEGLRANISFDPRGSNSLGRVANEAYIDDASGATDMEKGTVKFFNETKGAAPGGGDPQATGPIRLDPTPARAADADGHGAQKRKLSGGIDGKNNNRDSAPDAGEAGGAAGDPSDGGDGDGARSANVVGTVTGVIVDRDAADAGGGPVREGTSPAGGGEADTGEPALATTVKNSIGNIRREEAPGGSSADDAGGGPAEAKVIVKEIKVTPSADDDMTKEGAVEDAFVKTPGATNLDPDSGADAAKIYTSADGKPGVATVLSPGATNLDPEEGTHNIAQEEEAPFAKIEMDYKREAGSGMATGKAVVEKDHGAQVAENGGSPADAERMSGKIALVREQDPGTSGPGDDSIDVSDDGGAQAATIKTTKSNTFGQGGEPDDDGLTAPDDDGSQMAAVGKQKKWLTSNFREGDPGDDDDGPSTLLDLSDSADGDGPAVADLDLDGMADVADIDGDPDFDTDAARFDLENTMVDN